MDEIETLREQAARYRKLLETIDDPKARDVLIALAADLDAQADAVGRQAAEQSPPSEKN